MIPHEAIKDGDVREMNGNLRRLVAYIKCPNIENAVIKNGNLSNMRSNTCIAITIYNQDRQRFGLRILVASRFVLPVRSVPQRVRIGSRVHSLIVTNVPL